MSNFYKKTVNFINRKYKQDDRIMLLKYLDSEFFQDDLDKFMNKQANAGEPVSVMLATECVIESYLQNEDDSQDLTPLDFRGMI